MTTGRLRAHDPRQTDATAWVHGGLAFGSSGELVTFDQGTRELVIVSLPGRVRSMTKRLPTPARSAHAIVRDDHRPGGGFWIVDPGVVSRVDQGQVVTDRQAAWVGLILDDGSVGLRLVKPRIRAFRDVEFRPTALVTGGRHEIEYWLADGYGTGHIVRYDAGGEVLGLIDASRLDPAGFRVPHGISPWTDGQVLVADRGHGRIVVVDDTGTAVRSLGDGRLSRPAAVVGRGPDVVVADLDGRISVLDSDGHVARPHVGSRYRRPGRYWPNDGRAGSVRAPAYRSPDVMRSPHGLAIDQEGTIWTSEWVVGGRLTSIRLPTSS